MMLRSQKNHQIIVSDNSFNRRFFEERDVVDIARELIGARIESHIQENFTSGIIVETEAYKAPKDKASHAYNYRRTERTETMYGKGGLAYVYLCYGIHHLFNVVTGPENTPHAVLIRAVVPVTGLDIMYQRRNIKSLKQLTNGPGKWTQAFGITTQFTGIDLLDQNSQIKIYPSPSKINSNKIIETPRIGIDYAEEWIDMPWRFLLKELA